MDLPFSAACERNKEPILGVLERYLPESGTILEIGSGTGQHVVYFAPRFRGLIWQPSDRAEYLAGLVARLKRDGCENIRPVVELDVLSGWPDEVFDAAYSANTAHIMSWEAVCAMFEGLSLRVRPGGIFCLYGPFNRNGEYTASTNRDFDLDLKRRDPRMGIRDIADLASLAERHQMDLEDAISLPANNQVLVFRRTDEPVDEA